MIEMMVITVALIVISSLVDREKTINGIKKGLMQFIKILPTLLTVIILISIVLHFISNELLTDYLGVKAGWGAYLSAAVLGSIAILPGFIAYPLSGILVHSGVSLSVIAVFITTLKMVGILTIPIEKKYFGLKIAIIRNTLSFFGAITVGGIMAVIYYLI